MQATFILKAYWSDEQSKERWHLRYSLKEMDFSQQDWDRETQYMENIISRSVREQLLLPENISDGEWNIKHRLFI